MSIKPFLFCALTGLVIVFSLARPVSADGMLEGIDVSHFQGEIEWASVAGDGVIFAFAKASEGETVTDPAFAANWQAMKAAGLVRGAYHFYISGDDPAAQLANFAASVTLESGDLPPMVDIETNGHSTQAAEDRIADLHRFLELVTAHFGVRPIIYTGPTFWRASFDDSFSDYHLWTAEYEVPTPAMETGWTDWTIWQHTEGGTVAGVSKPVDLNKFNGTDTDLAAFQLP